MIIYLIISLFLITYVFLIILFCVGWNLQKEFVCTEIFQPQTKISVVIAARNESVNIGRCLDSILAQSYPAHLFEVIVVDDHSTDETAAIIQSYSGRNIRLVALSDHIIAGERIVSFKKKALAAGIEHSSGTLIVTTDADCWMEKNWLASIASFCQLNDAEMIVAPVRFSSDSSFIQLFQSLDFMTMQGITVAVTRLGMGIMCNGANLAFTRKAYNSVNGYADVDHLISGDDYLLLSKIKKQFPEGVFYLKSTDAIVDTLPQYNWKGFFNQRIRWASKTGKYKDPVMTFILSMVYLFNAGLLIIFLLGIFDRKYFYLLCFAFLVKIIIELMFLFNVSKFFNRRNQLVFFPFFQPFHIVYIILAGFLSRLGTFKWKQRTLTQH